MSALPSPLKSPTCTSTQVTFGFQVVHREVVNDEPSETPTHHWPVCWRKPAISVFPSPLKSPVTTFVQGALGFQEPHRLAAKELAGGGATPGKRFTLAV